MPKLRRPRPEGAQQAHRWAKVLIGITTILGVVAIFTVGIRTQLLDTNEWVKLSSEVLDDPEVQEVLAAYIVDVLYTELDVGSGFAELLPEDLEGLGPPLAGALRGPLTDGVERTLDSNQFQTLWAESNRAAHEIMVAILRDETRSGTSTAEGTVTLELRSLVLAVGETVGLPQSVLDELPDDAGTIVVFESDELDKVQQQVEVLDFLAWFLLALVIALYAVAVYMARGRRLAVLRQVGWSLFVVGVIVIVSRAIAIRSLVDAIVDDPVGRPAAEDALSIATALLRQMGWSGVIYGLLIVAFTSLLGDGSRARSIRRALAPACNASVGTVAAGTGLVLLFLIWWRPGQAFEGWVTGLTLVALVIGAVATLRARTLEEFPDVSFDDVLDGVPFGRRSSPS